MGDSGWSNQRVDLIILQEAVTGFSGLFGYSPTIGPGNLIFSIAAVAGTDPYGNTYPAGLSITGSASSSITGIDYILNSAGLFIYSGAPAHGNLIGSIAPAAGSDTFGNAYKQGITDYGSGFLVQLNAGAATFAKVGSVLASDPNITGAATGDLLVQSGSTGANGSTIQVAETTGVLIEAQAGTPPNPLLTVNGNVLLNTSPGRIFASDPVNTGEESWHSLAAGNGWTGTVFYRLTAENEVFLWSNNLTAPAASANGVTIVTLPTGYLPAVNMTFMVGAQANTGTWPRFTLATTGTIQATGVLASSGVTLGITVPLDL